MNKPNKNWTKIKANSSWMMFKIMSEFVEGFDKMDEIGPCISIYGSARTPEESPYYQLGVEMAERLVEEGYGIITGGGPGIMEAANRGAKNMQGASVGLNIELPHEQFANPYIDNDKLINFNYFFARKVMFVKYAQAFILLPGGFGTMDEMFETLTLIQTQKIEKIPIILMGKEFWGGLVDWMENIMHKKHGNISEVDMKLFHLTDDPDEAVRIINDHYKEIGLRPNF
jgi:uncharacterized protein (TIGR00730 family)